MPFGLHDENLEAVSVVYAAYPAKTGLGRSEIALYGKGTVRLLEEEVANDANPRVHENPLPVPVLVSVLGVMEEEQFFSLEEIYMHQGTPIVNRVIELSLPGRTKRVVLSEPATSSPFERIAGAIKLAAGLAAPDALQFRFFQRF